MPEATSGLSIRQEVIAVLAEHMAGAHVPGGVEGVAAAAYRETLADALTAQAVTRVAFAQYRCVDTEDYARIFNVGFDEAWRQRDADVRTAGALALKEAAVEQRRLAEDARTNNGQAEHEEIADWLDERADDIPGRRLHCPVGCDEGACETCPCCCAGYCVYGLDGLPEDPEDVGRWLEVAAQHNPVATLLAARARPQLDRAELSRRLTAIVDRSMETGVLSHNELVDAVMALVYDADSPPV